MILNEITVNFGRSLGLNKVSMSIPARSTTVILGSSGSGKSTILRALLGLIKPVSGSISYDNKPLDHQDLERLRTKIGYVTQQGGLFPHLTIEKNAFLLPQYLGHELAHREQRLQQLLELTRLDPSVLDKYPQQLSGGQRQRCSLVRALMHDPST